MQEPPRWKAPWPEPPAVTNLEHEISPPPESYQPFRRPPASHIPPPRRMNNGFAPRGPPPPPNGFAPRRSPPQPNGFGSRPSPPENNGFPPRRSPPPNNGFAPRRSPPQMNGFGSRPPPPPMNDFAGPPPPHATAFASGPPPPARTNALAPGPPQAGEERYSWYPDIARSYDDESHYEPSVHSPDLNKEAEEEELVKPPLTKRQRYKKHLRRRWYAYAAALVISLAVGMPIMFLVVLPAVIQKMVDNAPFPIISVSLTSPTQNSFLLGMQSALNIPGGFTVSIDPANLTLAQASPTGPDPSFGSITIPQNSLHGNTTLNVGPENVTIQDSDAFIGFIHAAAVSESYQVTTTGSTTVHMGALHAHINIDRTLTVPGFNMFKGFSIPQVQLLLTPEADGSNIIGNATLPNPTVVTAELGDFTMNIQCGNLILGSAIVSDLLLKPGNNTMPIKGKVDIQTLIENLGDILTAQEDSLAKGNLIFNATMNTTTFHGERLVNFEKAFEGVVMTAQLPLSEVITDSLTGFLGGNSSIGSMIENLARNYNISDIGSFLGPLEKGGSSLSSILGPLEQEASSLLKPLEKGSSLSSLLGPLEQKASSLLGPLERGASSVLNNLGSLGG